MVTINTERKAVELRWDASLSDSEKVVLRGSRNGDVTTTNELPNDGLAPISFPFDFSGTSHIEVLGENGEAFDEGDITV